MKKRKRKPRVFVCTVPGTTANTNTTDATWTTTRGDQGEEMKRLRAIIDACTAVLLIARAKGEQP